MAAGFIPDMIRIARQINEGMAREAVSRLVKVLVGRGLPVKGARILIAGFTFKENCSDSRNTKVVDLLAHIRDWGMTGEVVDTWADPIVVHEEYGIEIRSALPDSGAYDAVILAVAHDDLVAEGPGRLRGLLRPGGVLFDLKAAFALQDSDLRL